jgi:hypothetical protein
LILDLNEPIAFAVGFFVGKKSDIFVFFLYIEGLIDIETLYMVFF